MGSSKRGNRQLVRRAVLGLLIVQVLLVTALVVYAQPADARDRLKVRADWDDYDYANPGKIVRNPVSVPYGDKEFSIIIHVGYNQTAVSGDSLSTQDDLSYMVGGSGGTTCSTGPRVGCNPEYSGTIANNKIPGLGYDGIYTRMFCWIFGCQHMDPTYSGSGWNMLTDDTTEFYCRVVYTPSQPSCVISFAHFGNDPTFSGASSTSFSATPTQPGRCGLLIGYPGTNAVGPGYAGVGGKGTWLYGVTTGSGDPTAFYSNPEESYLYRIAHQGDAFNTTDCVLNAPTDIFSDEVTRQMPLLLNVTRVESIMDPTKRANDFIDQVRIRAVASPPTIHFKAHRSGNFDCPMMQPKGPTDFAGILQSAIYDSINWPLTCPYNMHAPPCGPAAPPPMCTLAEDFDEDANGYNEVIQFTAAPGEFIIPGLGESHFVVTFDTLGNLPDGATILLMVEGRGNHGYTDPIFVPLVVDRTPPYLEAAVGIPGTTTMNLRFSEATSGRHWDQRHDYGCPQSNPANCPQRANLGNPAYRSGDVAANADIVYVDGNGLGVVQACGMQGYTDYYDHKTMKVDIYTNDIEGIGCTNPSLVLLDEDIGNDSLEFKSYVEDRAGNKFRNGLIIGYPGPALLKVEGDVGSDKLRVVFNESVSSRFGMKVEREFFSMDFLGHQPIAVKSVRSTVDDPVMTIGLNRTLTRDDLAEPAVALRIAKDSIYSTNSMNPASTQKVRVVDATRPYLKAAEMIDPDGDGLADSIRVTATEPINDGATATTLNPLDWNIDFGNKVEHPTRVVTGDAIRLPNVANDDTIYLILAKPRDNSSLTPVVYYQRFGLGTSDLATPPNGMIDAWVLSKDRLAPRVIDASVADVDRDGRLDTYNLRFSEQIDAQQLRKEDWRVDGTPLAGVETINGLNSTRVIMTFSERLAPETKFTPQLTYNGTSVEDLVGNLLVSPLGANQIHERRFVPPIMGYAGGVAGSKDVLLTFSSPLRQVGGGNLSTTDLLMLNPQASGPSSIVKMNHTEGNAWAIATLDEPLRAIDIGNMTFQVQYDVEEDDPLTPNVVLALPIKVSRLSVPQLQGIASVDADRDGHIDGVRVRFTKPVYDGYANSRLRPSEWVLSGDYGTEVGHHPTSLDSGTAVDDHEIFLRFDELPEFDTDVTPQVAYVGVGLVDANAVPFPNFVPTAAADGAASAPVSAKTLDTDADGRLDTYLLAWSEALAQDSVTNAGWSVEGYVVNRTLAVPGSPRQIIVRLFEGLQADTGALPNLTYAGGTLRDATGNAVLAFNETHLVRVDGAAPTVRSARTLDADNDHRVDGYVVRFSEAVDPATLVLDDWGVVGRVIGSRAALLPDAIQLDFDELTGPYDTASIPDVTYTKPQNRTTDVWGNMMTNITVPHDIEHDGVPPIALEALTKDTNADGEIGTYEARFSERMLPGQEDGSGWSVEGYTVRFSHDGPTPDVLKIGFYQSGGPDTGAVPNLTYSGSAATDLAGNLLGAIPAGALRLVDDAPPVVYEARTQDRNANHKIDRYAVSFSESFDPALHELSAWKVLDRAVTGTTLSGTSLLIDINESAAPDTGDLPDLTYTPAVRRIRDAAGNDMINIARDENVETDGVAPILLAARTDDSNGDGKIGTLVLLFSEDIDEYTFLEDEWHVGGHSVRNFRLGDNANEFFLGIVQTDDVDTSAVPTLSYDGASLADWAGNLLGAFQTGQVPVADGAAPAMYDVSTVGDGLGKVRAVDVKLSEPVSMTGARGADFRFTGCTCAQPAFEAVSPTEFRLVFEPEGGTNLLPQVTYEPGAGAHLIQDLSGSSNALQEDAQETRDAAPPQVLGAATMDLNRNGHLDALRITVSEPVDATTLRLIGWTITGHLPTAISAAGPNLLEIRFQEADFWDTSELPSFGYATPTDPTVDAAGNALASYVSGTEAVRDLAPPLIAAISGNAGVPTLTVNFTEPVANRNGLALTPENFDLLDSSFDEVEGRIRAVDHTPESATATLHLDPALTRGEFLSYLLGVELRAVYGVRDGLPVPHDLVWDFADGRATGMYFLDVEVDVLAPDSARISWITDGTRDVRSPVSYVQYGIDSSLASATAPKPGFGPLNVTLTGLMPDSYYTFEIRGNFTGARSLSTSMWYSFATRAFPTISNVSVTNLTTTSARVQYDVSFPDPGWMTFVAYNTTGGQTLDRQTPHVTTGGRVRADLTGFRAGQTNAFRIFVAQVNGTSWDQSAPMTLRTLDPLPRPQILDVAVTSITRTTAVVSWSVLGQGNLTSWISYGPTPDADVSETQKQIGQGSTSVELQDLRPRTRYYYKVMAQVVNATGNISLVDTFQTLAEQASNPGPQPGGEGPALFPVVGNLTAVPGLKRIELVWARPFVEDVGGFLIWRSDTTRFVMIADITDPFQTTYVDAHANLSRDQNYIVTYYLQNGDSGPSDIRGDVSFPMGEAFRVAAALPEEEYEELETPVGATSVWFKQWPILLGLAVLIAIEAARLRVAMRKKQGGK